MWLQMGGLGVHLSQERGWGGEPSPHHRSRCPSPDSMYRQQLMSPCPPRQPMHFFTVLALVLALLVSFLAASGNIGVRGGLEWAGLGSRWPTKHWASWLQVASRGSVGVGRCTPRLETQLRPLGLRVHGSKGQP